MGACLSVCLLVGWWSLAPETFRSLQEFALTPDVTQPTRFVYVNGEPVVLWENGDVELYCEGDIRLTLAELKQIVRLADRFMYERERLLTF